VEVRAARAGDARAIAQVHVRTWQAAYTHVFPAEGLEGLSAGLDRRVEFWRGMIDSRAPRTHTLVAVDDDIVGFAHAGPARDDDLDPEHTGELYAIYVLPDAWGNGAGQALMAELLASLREEGFREAMLWVLEDNPRTRRFYELAGWRPDGAVRSDSFLETQVSEVRYRIALAPSQ
jgi:GNAT superfamily N-acetyltransferase